MRGRWCDEQRWDAEAFSVTYTKVLIYLSIDGNAQFFCFAFLMPPLSSSSFFSHVSLFLTVASGTIWCVGLDSAWKPPRNFSSKRF